jgi:hypothetical protein
MEWVNPKRWRTRPQETPVAFTAADRVTDRPSSGGSS